jgi:hypothetical protein
MENATGQVAVVRGSVATADGPVVVGADGSERAAHTIGVAFEEADRRGTTLTAIRAYEPPAPRDWSSSDRTDTAPSPVPCSAPSASRYCTTPTARS